jgi:glycosyltransferase involved in cell wall biosynthesis
LLEYFSARDASLNFECSDHFYMKILLLDNSISAGGGVSSYVKNLKRLLSQRHQVNLFGCVPKFELANYNNLESYKLPRETNLQGIRTIYDFSRYFWNPTAARYLRKLLDNSKPDIVHINSYHGHLTPSVLFEIKKRRIPIIQTLHGFLDLCPVETMLRNGNFCDQCAIKGFHQAALFKCNRRSIIRSTIVASESYTRKRLSKNKIDKYICVSEFQQKILERYYNDRKFEIVENFTFPIFSKVDKCNDEYLIYPTRIIENKGIMNLIMIYKSDVQNKLPKVKIIGTGELEAYFKHLVVSLKLQKRIEFCGFFSKEKLKFYYQECLAVLNFSQLNETFGLTAIEAMAANKFVFVSDRGALPFLVNEYTGAIIDFNKSDEAIIQFIDQKMQTVRNYQGREIFQYYQDRFSPDVHLSKLEKIYFEVVNSTEALSDEI